MTVTCRKDEYMLLDVGEASLQQLIQLYGMEKAAHILTNLKAIFISHLHYDHHGVGVTISLVLVKVVWIFSDQY